MSFLNENGVASLWANVVAFVTQSIQAIPTPDVSGQISTHNTDTDAHEDIRGTIDKIEANVGNVYTKNEVDTKLSGKADSSNVYTKIDANNTFISKTDANSTFATKIETGQIEEDIEAINANKADASKVYTKTEVDNTFAKKGTSLAGYGITNAYTKDEVNNTFITKTNADQKFATIETTNALSNSVSNKADKATTYTKDEINGKLTGALHYKRSYTTLEELNSAVAASDRAQGDVYNITTAGGTDAHGTAIKAGDNVIWNGTGWDASSGTMDLSAYSTKEEVDAVNEALAAKIQIVRWGEND